MNPAQIKAETQRWIDAIVIGLDLCPFAKRSIDHGGLRIEVTDAASEADLVRALDAELQFFMEPRSQSLDSALLVVPNGFDDFLDFNDFLGVAAERVERAALDTEIQIASFHPRYRFAGTDPSEISNYTNRSPYPMLHLLRESRVGEAIASHPDPEGIPDRNIANLEKLGVDRLRAILRRADLPDLDED